MEKQEAVYQKHEQDAVEAQRVLEENLRVAMEAGDTEKVSSLEEDLSKSRQTVAEAQKRLQDTQAKVEKLISDESNVKRELQEQVLKEKAHYHRKLSERLREKRRRQRKAKVAAETDGTEVEDSQKEMCHGHHHHHHHHHHRSRFSRQRL